MRRLSLVAKLQHTAAASTAVVKTTTRLQPHTPAQANELVARQGMSLGRHSLFGSVWDASDVSPQSTVVPLVPSSVVPRGCAAFAMPDGAAALEVLATAYTEQLTLADMTTFHKKVITNAKQTQEFYEMSLLKGFGGGGGGGGVVSAAAARGGATAAPTSGPGDASSSQDAATSPTSSKQAAAKTSFNVQLAAFPPESKIKLIKELRAVTNLPLGEAKAAIDKCPGLVATNMSKEDAEKLKGLFEGHGAKVELL